MNEKVTVKLALMTHPDKNGKLGHIDVWDISGENIDHELIKVLFDECSHECDNNVIEDCNKCEMFENLPPDANLIVKCELDYEKGNVSFYDSEPHVIAGYWEANIISVRDDIVRELEAGNDRSTIKKLDDIIKKSLEMQ